VYALMNLYRLPFSSSFFCAMTISFLRGTSGFARRRLMYQRRHTEQLPLRSSQGIMFTSLAWNIAVAGQKLLGVRYLSLGGSRFENSSLSCASRLA